MKLNFIYFLLAFLPFKVALADTLTTSKELYDKANNGDVKSMEILSRFYINQYSWRYNPEHSRYWRCRIEALNPNESSELDCDNLLKIGVEKHYDVFYERGQKIKDVELSNDVMKNLSLEVPAEREWHITWDRDECEKVCSYEISVDGYFYIGENKKYLIGRDPSISLSTDSTGEIWVTSGSIVTIQIPSKLVTISELAE